MLRQRLTLSVETVVQDAADQAKLFREAGDFRIATMRAVKAAELARDQIKANKYLNMKAAIEDGTMAKVSEEHIKKFVEVDEDVVGAEKAFNDAEIADENRKLDLESYRMRRDSLQLMANIANTEIAMQRNFTSAGEAFQKAEESVKKKYRMGKEVQS